jgi:hypothetical protein
MKHAAIALTFATLVLAGTPVLAANPVKPSAPGSDKLLGVMSRFEPRFERWQAPFRRPVHPPKQTGASNPATPDPTRNTPGAEAKS